MTPQEINEAVARKLGWTQNEIGWRRHTQAVGWAEIDVPDYCHSIAAAWEIVDYLKNIWVGVRRNPEGKFNVVIADGEKALSEEIADTAPMAICLAFLKLEDK